MLLPPSGAGFSGNDSHVADRLTPAARHLFSLFLCSTPLPQWPLSTLIPFSTGSPSGAIVPWLPLRASCLVPGVFLPSGMRTAFFPLRSTAGEFPGPKPQCPYLLPIDPIKTGRNIDSGPWATAVLHRLSGRVPRPPLCPVKARTAGNRCCPV